MTLPESDAKVGTLAPEGTKTITYTYTVVQADVDEGRIDNTITATGKDNKGKTLTTTDNAEVTTVEADPELTVVKSADPASGVEVGDVVTYTVVVTNSGNVKTITYTYTVTQADVDAGKIDNKATATGKDPSNKDVTAYDEKTVTTVEADPELTVVKSADPASGVEVGDVITYTVTVTNSGNVTVTGIALSDTLVTLTEPEFDLAPEGTKTITYTYTVTQADVDAGKIDNKATAYERGQGRRRGHLHGHSRQHRQRNNYCRTYRP